MVMLQADATVVKTLVTAARTSRSKGMMPMRMMARMPILSHAFGGREPCSKELDNTHGVKTVLEEWGNCGEYDASFAAALEKEYRNETEL